MRKQTVSVRGIWWVLYRIANFATGWYSTKINKTDYRRISHYRSHNLEVIGSSPIWSTSSTRGVTDIVTPLYIYHRRRCRGGRPYIPEAMPFGQSATQPGRKAAPIFHLFRIWGRKRRKRHTRIPKTEQKKDIISEKIVILHFPISFTARSFTNHSPLKIQKDENHKMDNGHHSSGLIVSGLERRPLPPAQVRRLQGMQDRQ